MKRYIAVLLFLVFQFVFAAPASSNPGFARKFGYSCAMCHAGFPTLNAFGESFRDNGFQIPGEDVGDKSQKTGDHKLFLEPDLNIAARVDGGVSFRNDTATHSDIQVPSQLKLFIFGYLKKDIIFYSYFEANDNGSVSGLEDAYLYFNNIGNHELDFMIGQFQVTDSVYDRELRLTRQDISIYTTAVSKSGFDLTYHRGASFMFAPGMFEADVGLINGNGNIRGDGISNSNAIGPVDSFGNYDNSSFKDPFLHLSFKKDFFTLGLYGLYGEEEDKDTKIKNRFYRAGPDIRINQWMAPVDLKAEWLFGEDQNPGFSSISGDSLKINGGFVEALYHISEDWKSVVLYNRVQVSQQPALTVSTITLNLTYYILRNFKTFIEYTHDLEDLGIAHPEKTDNAQVAFVIAF
ncbi:MAG: hypothetical protein ACYDBV_01300 [Nitrospiria bacterium]